MGSTLRPADFWKLPESDQKSPTAKTTQTTTAAGNAAASEGGDQIVVGRAARLDVLAPLNTRVRLGGWTPGGVHPDRHFPAGSPSEVAAKEAGSR